MASFLDEDFLLETDTARDLYHNVARDLPIIDYHCHLPPEQIAEDHMFRSITEIWLDGDHYKWRAMRANGVPERAPARPREAGSRRGTEASPVPTKRAQPVRIKYSVVGEL